MSDTPPPKTLLGLKSPGFVLAWAFIIGIFIVALVVAGVSGFLW